MVDVVPDLIKLTFLDLSESLLNPKSISQLLKALPKTLRSLVLMGNPFSAKAVHSSTLLKTFDDYCSEVETGLTLLDMSNCFLDKQTITKLFASLMKLPTILSVNFSGSDISNL